MRIAYDHAAACRAGPALGVMALFKLVHKMLEEEEYQASKRHEENRRLEVGR